MDTFAKLESLWRPKHFKHVLFCLKYCAAYFENSFEYRGRKEDTLIIDGEVYTQHDIVKILSEYYTDSNNDYPCPFGDAVYLFFTDLVEDDVDILSELDEDVA